MNTCRFFLLATVFMAGFATTCMADDTEIFFNLDDESSVRPNLLFILDNSGSMDASVDTTPSYDAAQDYSGSYAGDKYYFRKKVCERVWWWTSCEWSNFYTMNVADSTCSYIDNGISSSGHLVGLRMAYRYRGSWEEFRTQNVSSQYDCQLDNDVDIDWTFYDRVDVYSANYLNYLESRTVTSSTRMEIVKEVAKDLVDSISGVNVGLMSFNKDGHARQGGRILVPIANVDDNRTQFKTAVDALGPDTNTPLSETLFGAMRYFSGGAPFLDGNPVAGTVDESGEYVSPIGQSCQANNIIFLTDGEPTCDGASRCAGADSDLNEDIQSQAAMEAVVGDCVGNCLDEIAAYMQENDLSGSFDGKQTVTTYTVGFHTNQELLSNAAQSGGGAYRVAEDAAGLQDVFEDFVRSVLAVNTTFVAPGIAVNTFNRLNHLDSLYFSVFQPDISPLWDGNLKRYRLGSNGKIYDVNSSEAVDPTTGFFKAGSQSWWSPSADGPVVAAGGVASQQPSDNTVRKVITNATATTLLTDASNAVSIANIDNLPKELFGDSAMLDGLHQKLINWTRGLDAQDEDGDGQTDDVRQFVADPLHSVPHLVIYGKSSEDVDAPESADDLDTTVFFGDNQGFIHAVNGNTGETYFSFIPKDLLRNQQVLMENSNSVTQRVYGMDGSIISWSHDENDDGEISADDGDKVFIYSGMRRGGRNYYALDVTDRQSPELLWEIKGGSGSFAELGQSWSRPVKTKLRTGKNTVREVVVFSGGYDPAQDDVTVRTADSMGRAVFIVDASTGELIWWAGPVDSGADLELNDMLYSIPSSPKVLDVTGDGTMNQIYVGDMGGQIWRFDFRNNESNGSLIATGGVIAELAGDDTANNRRFYHAPDLFGLKVDGKRYLGLLIGSGWQAHPLNKAIDDRIYMLRIADMIDPPGLSAGAVSYSSVKVTESDLFDTTDNLIAEGTTAQQDEARLALAAAKGWYIRLTRDGEKILSASQTIAGQVFITSYEPQRSVGSCLPSSGTSRLYHLNVADGTAVVNYNGLGDDDELTKEDREVLLSTLGLPPDPQRMRVDGKDIICVGAECMPVDSVTGVIETYWYEE